MGVAVPDSERSLESDWGLADSGTQTQSRARASLSGDGRNSASESAPQGRLHAGTGDRRDGPGGSCAVHRFERVTARPAAVTADGLQHEPASLVGSVIPGTYHRPNLEDSRIRLAVPDSQHTPMVKVGIPKSERLAGAGAEELAETQSMSST